MARLEKDGKIFEITSADRRYTTELCTHLLEGWTRVADPRCEEPLGAEPVEPQLEAALRADPTDTGAAIVYADWLAQRGHPRGALIVVQHRLALNPRDAELIEVERRIFEEAKESLVSRPLVAHLAILRGTVETALSRNLFEGGALAFDHGFIRKARLLLKERGGDEDLLWELLRHPSARVLAELDITVDRSRDAALVAAMITHGPRPPLRSLALHVVHRGGAVDLSDLDTAYPELAELDLTVDKVRLRELDVPLRRLAVVSEHSDLGATLARRTWEALEALEISGPPAAYHDALGGTGFPALRQLVVHGGDAIEVVCQMLVRAPVGPQLERVALRKLRLTEDAVRLLVAHRARFARLAALEVEADGHFLTRLRDAGYPI